MEKFDKNSKNVASDKKVKYWITLIEFSAACSFND